MQTHPLGKYQFHAFEFLHRGKKAYCIAVKEYYCEDEEVGAPADYDGSCDVDQLVPSDAYNLTIISSRGSFQTSISKEGNEWVGSDIDFENYIPDEPDDNPEEAYHKKKFRADVALHVNNSNEIALEVGPIIDKLEGESK